MWINMEKAGEHYILEIGQGLLNPFVSYKFYLTEEDVAMLSVFLKEVGF